jgi:hypothetical protein
MSWDRTFDDMWSEIVRNLRQRKVHYRIGTNVERGESYV